MDCVTGVTQCDDSSGCNFVCVAGVTCEMLLAAPNENPNQRAQVGQTHDEY